MSFQFLELMELLTLVLQSTPRSFVMCQGLEMNLAVSCTVFVVGRQASLVSGGTVR